MTKSFDECLKIAESVETRDEFVLEHKCRAAARWLGHDEEDWKALIQLIIHIDAGRVYSIDIRPKTKEEIESWRNYMMNR